MVRGTIEKGPEKEFNGILPRNCHQFRTARQQGRFL